MNPLEFFPISSVTPAPKPRSKVSLSGGPEPTVATGSQVESEKEKAVLQTARLYITYFNPAIPSHPSLLVKLWNEPHVAKYNGDSDVDSLESAQAEIRRSFLPEYSRNGYSVFVVLLKPAPGAPMDQCEPVGTASLRRGADPDSYTVPDIGFAMLEQHTGKGYATESARSLVDWARGELGLAGVFGFADPENLSSRRVLEKLGFQDRGLRTLPSFGKTQIYALPDMDQDLSVYNMLGD